MDLNFFKDDRDIMKAAPIPERLKKAEKILIITGDKTEDMEFFYPYYRLMEAGYTVDVATVDGESFEGKKGYAFKQTIAIETARPDDYALLYIPGGKAPAELREEDTVLDFVRQFAQSGKPIAAICHGPQVLISAGLLQGRKISAYPGIKDELEEAGAMFVDEALAIDGQFITSRLPGDLHRHLSGVMDVLQKRASGQRAVA
jgi:protease I